MAAAIDGEIFEYAHLLPLSPSSEIYLIREPGGG
jgi:hypothetical protein